jgi:hypothetical protein
VSHSFFVLFFAPSSPINHPCPPLPCCCAMVLCSAVQASGTDSGECLVHDLSSLGCGQANGCAGHVVSAVVALPESADAVTAVAWHPCGALLVGTAAGAGLCLAGCCWSVCVCMHACD